MKNKTDAIITALVQNSVVDAADIQKIRTHIEQHSADHESSILLRLFFWIGAFLTGICLSLYLSQADPLKNTNDLIKLIMSLVVFIPSALILERIARGKQSIGVVTLLQFSIALLWVGKYYFCTVFSHIGSTYTLLLESIGITLITALIYPFFRQEIDRFLSPLLSLTLLFASTIVDIKDPVLRDYLPKILILLEMFALIAIFFHRKTPYSLIPLAYAIATALVTQSLFSHFYGFSHLSMLLSTIIAGTGLLAAIYLINREKRLLTLEQGLLITVAVASLIYFNVSEILLSMLILVVGYARREAIFFWMGLVFLPIFIILYYYEVEMTLLAKSFSLMGTGLVLLAGKFYVDHRVINQSRQS
jgi:uncharacterized membrane protein